MIYKVQVKEVFFRIATVQAGTIEEAREIALEMALDNEAELENTESEFLDPDSWEIEEVG